MVSYKVKRLVVCGVFETDGINHELAWQFDVVAVPIQRRQRLFQIVDNKILNLGDHSFVANEKVQHSFSGLHHVDCNVQNGRKQALWIKFNRPVDSESRSLEIAVGGSKHPAGVQACEYCASSECEHVSIKEVACYRSERTPMGCAEPHSKGG